MRRHPDGFNQETATNRGMLVWLRWGGKTAASAVISVEYGEIPEFLVSHGYGPEGKSPKREVDRWRAESKRKTDTK